MEEGLNPKTLKRFAFRAFLFYLLGLKASFRLAIKQKTPHFREGFLACRGSRIRTYDPLLPKQVR